MCMMVFMPKLVPVPVTELYVVWPFVVGKQLLLVNIGSTMETCGWKTTSSREHWRNNGKLWSGNDFLVGERLLPVNIGATCQVRLKKPVSGVVI